MQRQLTALQQRNEQMQREIQSAPKTVELDSAIRDAIAGHLQLQPLDAARRKRTISRYPKSDQLPKAITDDNGLASKAIADPVGKRTVTQDLPQLQRDALDVLRMAATGWHQALQLEGNTPRSEFLMEVIRDIAIISCDNAQRMAEKQLRQAFEHAKAKGAQAIIDLGDNSSSIDYEDHSIFQLAHVDAIQQIRKYNAAVEPRRQGNGRSGNGNRNNGYARNNYRRGAFGNGRNGRGGFSQGSPSRNGSGWRPNYHSTSSHSNNRSNDSNRMRE